MEYLGSKFHFSVSPQYNSIVLVICLVIVNG